MKDILEIMINIIIKAIKIWFIIIIITTAFISPVMLEYLFNYKLPYLLEVILSAPVVIMLIEYLNEKLK